jgi:subtilisin-like proprotein convertase family protein
MRQGGIVKRTGIAGVSCSLIVAAGLVVWSAGPAAATVFSNAAAITIPGVGTGPAAASLYPSPITVSGLSGTIVDVNVTLTGLSHTFPDDVDVLLVGPLGQKVVLMADVGGGLDVVSIGLTFDDAASASLPDVAQIVAGTFKPTVGVGGAFNGAAPAPAGPYGTTLSGFNATAPNGTWSLFVWDDAGGDSGSISGGWSLDILATPTITSFAPTGGRVGDAVIITGTSLTGTSAVSFHGIPAISFTVDSPTQVTATVPAGASTGPISLTTLGGTAASATNFVVRHSRDVSLTLNGNKAQGTVNVTDGFAACRSGVPVKVQHLKKGVWKTVGSTLTKANGTYRVPGLTDPGKYRTVAKKITLGSGDVCLKDISPKDHK